MRLIRRTGGLFVLAVLLGCSSDNVLRPPAGLKYSVAVAACGPADGPAVAIFLTQDPAQAPNPAPPYVRIYIDLTYGQLDGRTRSVRGSSADASAWFQYVTDAMEEATNGFVIASYSSADNTVSGSVDMVFPTAGHIVGAFHAPFFPNQAFCN